MGTLKHGGLWAAVLAIAMTVGCGEGGSSSAAPSAAQKATAQQANVASSSMEQVMDASNKAVVESGAPGSTSSKSSTAVMTVNYQASVNVTVDLDGLNDQGQDAFPNATGQFSVSATGTIVGDSSAGEATYAVHVAWITDGVFTDPNNGYTATIASGSNWNYSLVIQWSKTDDLNWSIQATADVNGSLNATVTDGTTVWTITGTVERHVSLTLSRTAGNWAFTFSLTGHRLITVTNGSEFHTVEIITSALDHIVIIVDGVSYGPYTAAQILWWWAFKCNG